ncbi:hypothetical protein BBJ28_00007164 [Nothophytophthora sp. Chile5]|nr:hypothetical protein BBJ28_00007164 [Nothophytophthora sp. Chile5]
MLPLRRHLRAPCARHAARAGSSLLAPRPAALAVSGVRAFRSLGLNDALANRLAALGLSTPTAAQLKAIPSILNGEDVVVAAETGGGKTLAFLLPLVEQLQRHPLPASDIRLPAALVLTTSQELVRQLAAVLHQVDPELARLATSLSSSRQTLSSSRACPLVFATPGALLRATKPRDFRFTQLVVVDEADMLLGGGFEKETKQILATIRNQPLLQPELNRVDAPDEEQSDRRDDLHGSTERTQTVFSAISSPSSLACSHIPMKMKMRWLRSLTALCSGDPRDDPRLRQALGAPLHRLQVPVRGVRHHSGPPALSFMARGEFVDERHARSELLFDILTTASSTSDADASTPATAGQKTLVFTNSIASADALFDFLQREKGMTSCALFHKEVDREERQQLLQRLDSDDAGDQELVVVCTDIAARGLDTTKVRHVVQFEFASDVVSYLHRIGRTGRAGTTGDVTSIESTENSLVLDKIHEAGEATLQNAFSRKRSLRKKFKKALRPASGDY